jgi:hypothetical protein
MNFDDFAMLLAAAILAAPVVLAVWPEGPEYMVLERMAQGDSSMDIFIGIPDRVVKEFVNRQPDESNDDPAYRAFISQVRQSAVQTLERRRAKN